MYRLADGHPQSRAALAAAAAVDAEDLNAALEELEAAGLTIITAANGELRLSEPIRWIDIDAVHEAIGPVGQSQIGRIDYDIVSASTNRSLLEAPVPAPGRLHVAIAEHQTAGRGRRGRDWVMPPGAGLALSVAWRFEPRPPTLTALSLAIGTAARRAIAEVAGIEVGLKWPNDLIVAGRKLGGILVELESLGDDACLVVVGIGINVSVPAAVLNRVGSAGFGAIDLASAASDLRPDRSLLAGRLIAQFVELLTCFAAQGFAPYRDEWEAAHVLAGQAIELQTAHGTESGTVCGIDADGALIVADASGERRRVVSGDVTVRVN